MKLEHAWMLKGFLIGQNAPSQIMEPVDELIATFEGPTVQVANLPDPTQVKVVEIISLETESPLKVRKPWSPEAKAAAADRMRERQAAKKAAKSGEAQAPSQSGA